MMSWLDRSLRTWSERKLPAVLDYRCNVCGSAANSPRDELGRENATCPDCGSTVRMRAIVHLVSMAVFGESLALPDFPERRDICGLGLSDWHRYAAPLAEKFNYSNTFYHQEPFLDITDVPEARRGSCDFVISSDVFEHVLPPVNKAFEGARRLLKPGGSLILTVPFATERKHTREHFPTLNVKDFEIVGGEQGPWRLINRRQDGVVEEFDQLVFHGGPGETLELREFARASIRKELKAAGFVDIQFAQRHVPEFGIYWKHPWSIPVVARAPRQSRFAFSVRRAAPAAA